MEIIHMETSFDTVNIHLLFAELRSLVVLQLIKALDYSSTAAERVGNVLSEKLTVSKGVEQGCFLTPLLYNVLLLAITIIASDPQNPAGIRPWYTFEGGFFRLQDLRFREKLDMSLYVTSNIWTTLMW